MSAPDPGFDRAVMAAPIVDNASERLYTIGELEYDGPRCPDCDTPVDSDGGMCEECGDSPYGGNLDDYKGRDDR